MEKKPHKESILQRWKSSKKEFATKNTLSKAPDNSNVPLTQGQERIWFLQQLYPNNPFYNYVEQYDLRGSLNIDILKDAFKVLFKSYDILRSYYPIESGKPKLKIDNLVDLPIHYYNLTDVPEIEKKGKIDDLISKESIRNFDLAKAPLLSVSFIQESVSHIKVLVAMHHIITDEWSMGILRKKVAEYYRKAINGEVLQAKKIDYTYADFAYGQQLSKKNEEQLDYWKSTLGGEISQLQLPFRDVRKSKPDFVGSYVTEEYNPELSKKILELSKTLGKTPFVLLLSAFYILLNKYSGQYDILIGSPISIRKNKSLENLIGFLNDTLVLRNKIDSKISFIDFIHKTEKIVLEAFANMEVSFGTLVKELRPERSVSSNPFFNTMFVYNNNLIDTNSFGEEIEFSYDAVFTKTAKFDLTLFIHEKSGILSATFEYAVDAFEESTIKDFHKHLKIILETISVTPDVKIADIDLIEDEELQSLISHNPIQEKYFGGYHAIHEIIQNVAEKNAEHPALVFEDKILSYRNLEKKAIQLAHTIVDSTGGANITIGLSIPQSLDMIVGVLGILKSGAAYLPIDPDYPLERVEFMLEDSEVDILVTTIELDQKFSDFKGKILHIDAIPNTEYLKTDLPSVSDNDLAYVIYTSGSSGKPKGVPISHKNIISSTAGRLDFYPENPKAFLLMSSISFDSSKAGLFWTLCTGGTLVIAPKRLEQDMEAIGQVIEKNAVTHTLMLPTLYQAILENIGLEKLQSLNTVIVAGEASSPMIVQKHFEKIAEVALYNEYGPTEASVWCIAHKLTKDQQNGKIPIGRAVADAKIAILNQNQKPVPKGAIGEIYVAGRGLSKGYIKREDLSQKAFLNLEFLGEKEKWYRTGDLGKYNSEGNIEFLGRADEQIKIRGYRVELGDIEKVILNFEAVKEVVVLPEMSDESKKIKRLIAYLKIDHEVTIDIQFLRTMLKQQLPAYMIPSNFVILEDILKLPNGKVDKKRLLKSYTLENHSDSKLKIVPASNLIEEKLVSIWKNILRLDSIGITDNFFELGGDSILSIQVISQARKIGLSLSPNLLFKYQTIQELALAIPEYSKNVKPVEIVSGSTPMVPIQKWFFKEHKNASHYWNQGVRITNLNGTKKESIQQVVLTLLETHDALRLSFQSSVETKNASFVSVDELSPIEIISLDTNEANRKDEYIDRELERIQQNLDLSKGNLFKCIILENNNNRIDECILLAHHLVIDAVSWPLLTQDFLEGIEQCQIGKPLQLSQGTTSIKKWGQHLEALSKSELILNEKGYWENQSSAYLKFPDMKKSSPPYLEKDIETLKFDFDTELTHNLLTKALESYSTRVDELFISALIIALRDWCRTDSIPLFLERHGRETLDTTFDLSNTIGWFTSFFPCTFNVIDKDYEKVIIAVKEQIRKIPNGGIGYGILKYYNNSLKSTPKPQVVFNYLGKQEYNNSVQFLFSGMRSPESERNYPIEINAYIINNKVQITMNFASTVFSKTAMVEFADIFKKQLETLISFCIEKEDKTYTPADFTEVDLDTEDLENLLDDLEL